MPCLQMEPPEVNGGEEAMEPLSSDLQGTAPISAAVGRGDGVGSLAAAWPAGVAQAVGAEEPEGSAELGAVGMRVVPALAAVVGKLEGGSVIDVRGTMEVGVGVQCLQRMRKEKGKAGSAGDALTGAEQSAGLDFAL